MSPSVRHCDSGRNVRCSDDTSLCFAICTHAAVSCRSTSSASASGCAKETAAGRRRERHADLQLRIVLAAGAMPRVGPLRDRRRIHRVNDSSCTSARRRSRWNWPGPRLCLRARRETVASRCARWRCRSFRVRAEIRDRGTDCRGSARPDSRTHSRPARESRRWNARFLPYDGASDVTALSRLVRLVRIPDLPVNGISTLPRSEDLTSGPVGRHLIRLTVPMFLGISSMILASMIDTIYIGWIGTQRTRRGQLFVSARDGAVVGIDGARHRRDVDHVAHARPRRSHARVCTRHAHAAAGVDSGRVAGGFRSLVRTAAVPR